MTRKETLEIAGGYFFNQSLQKKSEPTVLTQKEMIYEDLYAEVRDLGYPVYMFIQLHTCAVETRDGRLIPIFIKYIGILYNIMDHKNRPIHKYAIYENLLGLLENVCDKSITEYAIEEYWKDNTITKFRWGEILRKIKDDRYIDCYLEMLNDSKNYDYGDSIIILLADLKVYQAIPKMIELMQNMENETNIGALCSIIDAFGIYKLPELAQYLQPYITHKDSYIRNKAKAAMAKIDRAVAKQQKKINTEQMEV